MSSLTNLYLGEAAAGRRGWDCWTNLYFGEIAGVPEGVGQLDDRPQSIHDRPDDPICVIGYLIIPKSQDTIVLGFQ